MADAILAVISREDAIKRGLKRYFSGVPCSHGHIAPRNVGSNNECIACKAIRDREYGSKNKAAKAEYDRLYRLRNVEKLKTQRAAYRAKDINRARAAEYQKHYRRTKADELRAYRERNKERRAAGKRAWDAKNRASTRVYARKYNRERMRLNDSYAITARLRQRLAMAVKSGAKSGSAVRDLGCSIEFLRKHLESKFSDGMTWENWGLFGWHIDHIRPLSSFDLSDGKQLKQACHYTNLQPLWAQSNLTKGSRLDWVG